MRKRCTVIILALASVISASGLAASSDQRAPRRDRAVPELPSPAAPPLFTPDAPDASIAQQPAGPPPTPRHTGIKAMTKHLVTNFKYLPSKENLFWAGAGGGLALAVHPFDDDVNEALVGNDTAEKIFKPGEILGELGTLLGSASVVYAVGRIKDQPKVSHLGMDLIEALAMSEALTQTLKYTDQAGAAGWQQQEFVSIRPRCGHVRLRDGARAAPELAVFGAGVRVRVVRRDVAPARKPTLAERRGVRLGGRHHRRTHCDEP